MVQFHALSLLHQIRQSDRLAVSKLVTQLTKSNIRSPLAQCSIIRYVSQVCTTLNSWRLYEKYFQVISQTVPSDNASRPFFDFLEGCLRNKSEMVIFEAARWTDNTSRMYSLIFFHRAIINLKEVTARELQPAVSVLQLFLSSSKPVLRFGAVRAINQIALKNPLSVTNCNLDMENLISDQNRSIATLAITTLLKTGNESSIERLMKQITVFVSDIQVDKSSSFYGLSLTFLRFRMNSKLLWFKQFKLFAWNSHINTVPLWIFCQIFFVKRVDLHSRRLLLIQSFVS